MKQLQDQKFKVLKIRLFLEYTFNIGDRQSKIDPYCNIAWGQCNTTLKDKLQSFQNKPVRTIAGQSYEYTDHNSLLKEFGWLSVRTLIKLDMRVFMYNTQNDTAPEEFSQLFVSISNIHGCLIWSALTVIYNCQKWNSSVLRDPFLILMPNSGIASPPPRDQKRRVHCLFQGKM